MATKFNLTTKTYVSPDEFHEFIENNYLRLAFDSNQIYKNRMMMHPILYYANLNNDIVAADESGSFGPSHYILKKRVVSI